jgi:hypothetical protein
LVWNVSRFWNLLNLLKTMHFFSNTTMHAHNFFVYECYQWHVIEAIIELLPESNFISSFDLVKESVNSCNSLSFVISSESDDLLWKSYFKCEEKTNYFGTLTASVNVVTHEKITSLFWQDHILLLAFIFVCHFFQHMNELRKLTM